MTACPLSMSESVIYDFRDAFSVATLFRPAGAERERKHRVQSTFIKCLDLNINLNACFICSAGLKCLRTLMDIAGRSVRHVWQGARGRGGTDGDLCGRGSRLKNSSKRLEYGIELRGCCKRYCSAYGIWKRKGVATHESKPIIAYTKWFSLVFTSYFLQMISNISLFLEPFSMQYLVFPSTQRED